jgi:hypothetical protein
MQTSCAWAELDPPAPDLFSLASAREHPLATLPNLASSAPVTNHAPATSSSSPHVLPADLSNAVKHLDDQEFDRLVSAVVAEQRRRGRKASALNERNKARVEVTAPSLTRGQINAVRAAFKAGVTPSRIGRQFGISQSNVRKALASDESKR